VSALGAGATAETSHAWLLTVFTSAPPDTMAHVSTVDAAPASSTALTEIGGKLAPAASASAREHSYANPSTATWPDVPHVHPFPLKTAAGAAMLHGSVTATVTGLIDESVPTFETATLNRAMPPCTNPPPDWIDTIRSGCGARLASAGLISSRIASY
jgi:hypothetical protein